MHSTIPLEPALRQIARGATNVGNVEHLTVLRRCRFQARRAGRSPAGGVNRRLSVAYEPQARRADTFTLVSARRASWSWAFQRSGGLRHRLWLLRPAGTNGSRNSKIDASCCGWAVGHPGLRMNSDPGSIFQRHRGLHYIGGRSGMDGATHRPRIVGRPLRYGTGLRRHILDPRIPRWTQQ
jgi:hypothetical protein